MKSIKGKKDNAKFKGKCSEFKSHADKTLFNISCCKCRSFSLCSCARDRKFPEKEQTFLTDQRTSTKMAIGKVDAAVSKKNSHPGRKKNQILTVSDKTAKISR